MFNKNNTYIYCLCVIVYCFILFLAVGLKLYEIHQAILVHNQNVLEQNQYIEEHAKLFNLAKQEIQIRGEAVKLTNTQTIVISVLVCVSLSIVYVIFKT